MRFRSIKIAATAAITATVVTGVAACGSDDADTTPRTPSTTLGSTQAEDAPPAPTVEQLDAMLRRGFDPRIPAPEKVDLVQGTDVDPELVDRLARAASEADLAIEIVGVNEFGPGVASAAANFTINGHTSPAIISLVSEGGQWKLERSWACGVLTSAQMSSPACT